MREPSEERESQPHLAQRPSNRRRERVRLALSGLVVVAGSVALAQSGLFDGGDPTYDVPSGNLAAASAQDDVATGLSRWAPGQRKPAPLLRGRTLDGEELFLASYRGKVVVVNVWGSWCAPCRAEAPDLRRAAIETRSRGVRFLGIDTRDNDAAARAFVREFDIPYPSLVDDDGSILLSLRDTVPAQAIPSTMVVDRRGRIAARVVGRVTYPTLTGLIDDLLAGTPRGKG